MYDPGPGAGPDCVDRYLAHEFDPDVPLGETTGAYSLLTRQDEPELLPLCAADPECPGLQAGRWNIDPVSAGTMEH